MRTQKSRVEIDCKVTKCNIKADKDFEYGLNQNKTVYIRKKNTVAWELFYEKPTYIATKRKSSRDIVEFWNDSHCISLGKDKDGRFYKSAYDGVWMPFVTVENQRKHFRLGTFVATKRNKYWV